MNSIISRLLTILAALLMLVSMAACKPYPERISFKASSRYFRWLVEIDVVKLNGIRNPILEQGTAIINLPPNDNKELIVIDLQWVELDTRRSYKIALSLPIKNLLQNNNPNLISITIEIGMNGEVLVYGVSSKNDYERPVIMKSCGVRTPDHDESYQKTFEYLLENSNINDPKRLALPLPDSSCPDPGY